MPAFPPGMFHQWWKHLPGLLHLLVHGPTPEPTPGGVQPLISHTHIWRCRWNGQVWYARCIAYEWCTARVPC